MRPDWSFAMVGPVVKVDPNLLPHFAESVLARRARLPGAAELLPGVRRQHDVLRDQRGDGIHQPDQGAGILATGKPVISTPVKDVVRQYSDMVEHREDRRRIRRRRRAAAAKPDRGTHPARHRTWPSNAAGKAPSHTMQDLIKEAITKTDRRSAREDRAADRSGAGIPVPGDAGIVSVGRGALPHCVAEATRSVADSPDTMQLTKEHTHEPAKIVIIGAGPTGPGRRLTA